MWFWGAPPEHQETMKAVLIDPYNASQDKYELSVEFRNTVDKDISVALAANEGPDIVYGSGPSFVSPYAAAGKLENMDACSEKNGWKDRILAPIYESGTVNGSLYSLPNSLNTLGIFYNKKVLEAERLGTSEDHRGSREHHGPGDGQGHVCFRDRQQGLEAG